MNMNLHEASVQELQLELMRRASFNEFDGAMVVAELKSHPDLWEGALMDRPDLIKLRDLSEIWNVDTLWITPRPGKEDQLWNLAAQWDADEIDWIGGDGACRLLGFWSREASKRQQQILRLWWD
jgi:hypothetical protein